MSERTRTIILSSGGILVFMVLAVWWYSGFSLDFMKFFAATPDVVTATPTPDSPTALQPVAGGPVKCSPATQKTTAGATVTLRATGGIGAYVWFAPRATANGALVDGVAGPSITISYAGVGTKEVTLQSGRSDNSGNIDQVVCRVVVE